MVMKLLRLCNYVHAGDDTFDDILPCSSDFRINALSGSSLSFDKGEIEAIVLSRQKFYCKMHEKLDKFMDTLDIKFRQVIHFYIYMLIILVELVISYQLDIIGAFFIKHLYVNEFLVPT